MIPRLCIASLLFLVLTHANAEDITLPNGAIAHGVQKGTNVCEAFYYCQSEIEGFIDWAENTDRPATLEIYKRALDAIEQVTIGCNGPNPIAAWEKDTLIRFRMWMYTHGFKYFMQGNDSAIETMKMRDLIRLSTTACLETTTKVDACEHTRLCGDVRVTLGGKQIWPWK